MKRHFTLLFAGILACLGLPIFAQNCTGNLLTNPGFEICGGGTNSCLNDWSVTGSIGIVTDARSGSYAARSSGQAGSLSQIKPCSVGQTFSAVVWGKGTNTSSGYAPIVFLRFLQSNYAPIGDFTTAPIESRKQILTSQYTEHYVVATAPANAAYVHLLVMNEAGASFTVDDMHLCLGTGAGSNLPELFPLGYAVTENTQNPNGSTKISSGFLLQNSGSGTITNDFTIVWRISTDETPSANDYILHVQNFTNDLPPNQPIGIQQLAGNVPVGTPNLPPGTYKLIVCLDDGNTVVEGSEANNCLSGVVTIYGNSTACSMTASVAAMQCQDNGTPANPNDDRYKVFLNVSGTNTGIGWNATTSGASNNYSYGNNIELVGQFAISFGPWTLSLYDANSPTNPCSTTVNITPPAACSNGPGPGQVDLSLALQQLTASPAQWSNYSVKATISNAGPQAATGVKLKFAKPTGVVYVGGNQFTASQGTFNPNGDEVWTVGSIPANGSATLTVNYFLLNATAPVAYSQVTAANETDADSQPNNGTPPTPVQDDEASTAGGTPPQPCLINASITNFSCDNKGTPNDPQDDTYSYTYVVTNGNATGLWALFAGGASVAGGNYGEVMTRSGLYAAYGLNTNYLQVRDLTNPACTTFINFPQPVPCNPVSPDLTLADLQIPTPSVAAGAILNYNFDASNVGTAAVPGNFTIKSYISTDQTLSANDIQDGNINTGNYAAGFSVQNVAGASTIPANLAAGSYYLLVKIDGDNAIAEGNENNNVVVKPFTVMASNTGGNCEQSLSPTPMVCAAPMANGNIEVGFYAQGPTPYQRSAYSTNGSLVSTLPQTTYPATPAFVLGIENGSIVERNTNANGAITWQVSIPASIVSQYNPTVVCRQTGTNNLFLGGMNASGAVCLKVTDNLSVLNTLQLPFGLPTAIVPTSWGGAAFVTSLGSTFPQGSLGGNIYGISSNAALLYTKSMNTVASPNPTTISILPCGTDLFRLRGFAGFGHAGSSVSLDFDFDWQFGPQSAQLVRERMTGFRATSPLPVITETVHTFYNADGTKWRLTRRIQAADPQYNVAGTDGLFYEKLSATDQVLLTETLDKTKFDALADLQIYTVAEVQPGKLAFFGNKGGAAWYYNPFCGSGAQQPDLTLSNLQLSASSTAVGGNFNFTFTESNIGTAASGAFGRKSYVSTDQTISANDLLAASTTSNGLGAGATNSVTQTVILPATLAAGSYFLIVKIDADGVVAEGNENNNILVQSFTVTGGTPPSGDCSTITITPGPSKITIAGFSAPHVLIKVFKPNWTLAFECLDGTCTNPLVVSGLTAGTHHLQIKLLNASWGEICYRQQDVNVSSFGGNSGTNIAQEEDERFRLSFDKFYPNPTTFLTNIELFSPKEQAATLDFYNQQGRLVHTMKADLTEGVNTIEVMVFDWKSGAYNVIARGEETGLPAYGRFLKIWEE